MAFNDTLKGKAYYKKWLRENKELKKKIDRDYYMKNKKTVRAKQKESYLAKPLYQTWISMKNRCFNKNDPGYKYYGARGITVCDSWKHSYSAFENDMGPKPSKKHSIDRINSDGNYSPENCQWATNSEQSTNKRFRNKTGMRGVYKSHTRYATSLRINGKNVSFGTFGTKEEAHLMFCMAYFDKYGEEPPLNKDGA